MKIVQWKLLSLDSASCHAVLIELDAQEGMLDGVNVVVIEKQLRANAKMTFVSHALETYLCCRAFWLYGVILSVKRLPAWKPKRLRSAKLTSL